MTGKRCASCGHPEMDHVGLGCSVLDCDCRGFEEGDGVIGTVVEAGPALWAVDGEAVRQRATVKLR